MVGNSLTGVSTTGTCVLGIAAGLYGAWWVSWLAHFLYLEKAGSFDALNTVMLASFLMAAVMLCPLFCGLLLKVLRHWTARRKASRRGGGGPAP